MLEKKLNWKTDETVSTGKGATVQKFTASANGDQLEIDTEPWGEGDLKINGNVVAHVSDDMDAGAAFRDLEAVAEETEKDRSQDH